MLSKTTEYAIRALIYLEVISGKGQKAGVAELAEAIDSPKPFTAKVLQKLTKAGLVASHKGPAGGFFIPVNKVIHLIEVISVIEGNGVFEKCGLGLEKCNALHPCPIHNEYETIRNSFKKLVAGETISNLALKMEKGEAFLKKVVLT